QETEADGRGLEQVGLVLRVLDDRLDVLDRVARVHEAETDRDVAARVRLGGLGQLLRQELLAFHVAGDPETDRERTDLFRADRVFQGLAQDLLRGAGSGRARDLGLGEPVLHDADADTGPRLHV